jgi:uncharacterized protein (DUF952 family)
LSTPAPDSLYHIVPDRAWADAAAAGAYRPPSLASDGFIHLSTASQIDGTLRRHFANAIGLVLLTIDTGRLAAPVRWEEAPGGYGTYPHLYGPLNVDAVVTVDAIPDDPEDRSSCPPR